MARTLEFSLRLRAIAESKGIKELEKSLGRVATNGEKSLSRLSATLDRLGPKFVSAGKSLSVGLTAPLTAFAGASVKAFADFDDSFRAVETLFAGQGLGTAELEGTFDRLRDGIKDLNVQSGQGFEKLNKALFDTISAGVPAAGAIEAVGAAAKLAIAGQTDVSVATDGLTSALNAFNIEADQAESVAAKFFQAQQAGKTTIEELAGSFGVVAKNAETAGISFDELLAATSTITLGGVKTSSAFRGLKAAIVGIQKPTQDAQDEAERLGIQFDAAALRSKGLEDFINDLIQNPNFGPDSISKLFGSAEAQTAINGIIGKVDEFKGTLSTLGDTSGGLEGFGQAVERQSGSISQEFNRLQSLLQTFGAEIGERLAPIVSKFTGQLANFLNVLRDSGAINGFTIALGALAAAIGPVLIIVGKLAPGFNLLISGAARVVAGFERFGAAAVRLVGFIRNLISGAQPLIAVFRGIATVFRVVRTILAALSSTFGLVVGVIATVVAAFVRIQQQTQALSTIFSAIFEIIGSVVNIFFSLATEVLKFTGVFGAVQAVAGVVTSAFNTFISVISQVPVVLGNIASVISGAFSLAFNAIVILLSGVLKGIVAVIQGANRLASFLGKPLVSPATLNNLTQLQTKLDGIIKTSVDNNNITLGVKTKVETEVTPVVQPPEPVQVAEIAAAAQMGVQEQLNLQPPAELPIAPKISEDAIEGLKAQVASIPPIDLGEEGVTLSADNIKGAITDIGETAEMSIGEQASNAINSNLSGAFDGIIDGTKTVGEAFEDLANSIVDSLTKQALNAAIANVASSLFSSGGLVGGGSAPGFAQGGMIPGFMDGGATQRFPQGLLRGPGTGTSDSILARVSTGEYVSDAKTTAFFGEQFFKNLKSAARSGVNPFAQAEFATGGLVNAFSNATAKIQSIANVPRYMDGGIITRSNDSPAIAVSQNIQISNEGTGKQVERVERDAATNQITRIILGDIQGNGSISQNLQSAFGIRRQGSN